MNAPRPALRRMARRASAGFLASAFENLPLKLGALLIAILLWIYISAEEKSVAEFTVPLRIENFSSDLVITEGRVETVTVRLRGSPSVLKPVTPLEIDARVDLSRARLGEQMFPLGPAIVRRAPFGAEVEWVQPSRMTLKIEKRHRRAVPIEPVFQGEPPSGLRLRGWAVTPESVEVEGAQSQVEAARVTTEPIALGRRTQSFRESVRLLATPPEAEIRGRPEAVVGVRVEEETEPPRERDVARVPVEIEGARGRYRAQPARLRVRISGPRDLAEAIGAGDLLVWAELPAPRPRQPVRLPVKVRLREPERFLGVTVLGTDPGEVQILPLSGEGAGEGPP